MHLFSPLRVLSSICWYFCELFVQVKIVRWITAKVSFLSSPAVLLSNSNPTWNSTELELVKVGVDFVFQCHNKSKNKNKNNPHLILIYRMWLQVHNLGRVKFGSHLKLDPKLRLGGGCCSCSCSSCCDIGKQSQLQLQPVQVQLSSKSCWSLTILVS